MIKIICVGKIKEQFYREAALEYQKRLTKYHKIQIIEVEDISGDNVEIILKHEAELTLKYITDKDFVITMEIAGKKINSLELAKKIENQLMINSNMVFIIGGSYGIHSSIKEKSNFKLSFSDLTFPHQLFRIILLEQLYRSFKIINNEAYHK